MESICWQEIIASRNARGNLYGKLVATIDVVCCGHLREQSKISRSTNQVVRLRAQDFLFAIW